jgi:hypothetical protein
MRGKTIWGAWLLVACVALAPVGAYAQDATGYAQPDWELPVPLGSTRPEDGGLFLFGEYVMFRQTNPLKDQLVAVRGFVAVDDTVLGPGTAGTFIGSRVSALDVHQITGPNGYQPGFAFGAGWKFKDGSALTFDWMYLSEHRTQALATQAPLDFRVRSDFANSFLTSYVYNFPPDYAGPPFKISVGGPQALHGIWDGALTQVITFVQRVQQWEATYRTPIYETDDCRVQALIGPRFFWMWERFKWTTTSADEFGLFTAADIAIYDNIVSNRMYGIHTGTSSEWYLGAGVALMCDVEAALLLDSVKERASYVRGDRFGPAPESKRAKHEWTLVPELQAMLGVMWYPVQSVQIRAGYDVMAFFNTISSPNPIDLNYSSVDPKWVSTFRFFDGWRFGVEISF